MSQPIAIDLVNVTGGTSALSLTSVTGSVTVSNSTFTNTTGAEVLISGGTGAVTIGAVDQQQRRAVDRHPEPHRRHRDVHGLDYG